MAWCTAALETVGQRCCACKSMKNQRKMYPKDGEGDVFHALFKACNAAAIGTRKNEVVSACGLWGGSVLLLSLKDFHGQELISEEGLCM